MSVIKERIKNLLRKWGWEVKQFNINTSERAVMQRALQHYSIDMVIDVGANTGQYALELMEAGYRGPIFSFEPIQQAFTQLKKNASRFPQWQVFPLAVGSSIQELEINISDNLVSSSFLDVKQASIHAEPKTRYTRKEKVKMTTLDSFLGDHNLDQFRAPLLKMDVQGFELEVLKGAVTILPKIKILQAELSFVPLYEGGPLYQEFLSRMADLDLEIYTIMPGFRDPDSGRMLQADGIFINRNL